MADRDSTNLETLIGGCIRGEQRAQEQLFKKYFGYALSVALLYCVDNDCAMEVVNDSFLKLFTEIKRLKPISSFKPWFRKIIINTALDKLRKQRRSLEVVELDKQMPPTQENSALSNFERGEIERLLSYLPHILKMVFALYEIEGFSHKEIAKMMKISESSSRAYLTRAKERLRQLYILNTR